VCEGVVRQRTRLDERMMAVMALMEWPHQLGTLTAENVLPWFSSASCT
jgi:hypothetical protein